MATFAELTGYKLPANAAEDSYSILPLLTGKATKLPNHPNIINQDYSGTLAIRQGPWKLVLKGKKLELYNLDEDLKEKHNIKDQHPELTQKLFADLKSSVEKGRTTLGSKQPNYKNSTSWAPHPW
jgi:arylsulfatase A-like enzyme